MTIFEFLEHGTFPLFFSLLQMLSWVSKMCSFSCLSFPPSPTSGFAWRNTIISAYLFKYYSLQKAYPNSSLPVLSFIICAHSTLFLPQLHTCYDILLIVDICLKISFHGQKVRSLRTEAESVMLTRTSSMPRVLVISQKVNVHL